MCRRITCRACGRPSFAGCGAHVESVLGGVPPAERCQCNGKKKAPPAPAAPESARPWWALWR